MKAGNYTRGSLVAEGILGPSLLFEKGIEEMVKWYLLSKITPSLFTLKEGSTSHPDPLSSGAREEPPYSVLRTATL